MEPMRAPAAESPANLKRQTRGGLDGLAVARESVVKLESELGMFSISDSESEFEALAGVDILGLNQDKP